MYPDQESQRGQQNYLDFDPSSSMSTLEQNAHKGMQHTKAKCQSQFLPLSWESYLVIMSWKALLTERGNYYKIYISKL